MKSIRSIALAIAVGAVCAPALASQDSQHQGHHPTESSAATPKGAASAPTSASIAARPDQAMAGMDAQMKAMQEMQEMHEKMMAAKTPEQRKAMMAEHMKVMEGGMKMMSDMSPGGAGAMKCDMGEHQKQMEKRMQMMQSMMQMMMDRMHTTPKD